MILFAMILVAILGTIAVAIEMGLVRVSRERMQSATDAAALEILRERDFPVTDPEKNDPQARDLGRRERNKLFASWPYAGQLSSSYATDGAADEMGEFAISVTPGDGEVNLHQRLNGVLRSVPVLETNFDSSGQVLAVNAAHGDIVSGSFSGHVPGGWIGADGNPIHVEALGAAGDSLERVDFVPGAPSEAFAQEAVLVRRRRTNAQGFGPLSALDIQPGISSSGLTFPLTFGAGAPFMGADPSQGYSLRHHGLPLRAVSIAAARPALRVGAPRPDLGDEWAVGAAPFTILDLAWRFSLDWVANPDGSEYVLLTINSILGLGEAEDDSELVGLLCQPLPRRIGDRIIPLDPDDGAGIDYRSSDFWTVGDSYAPSLYRQLYTNEQGENEGWRWYVSGFYRLRTELYVDANNEPILTQAGVEQIKMTRLNNPMSPGHAYIAPRNASATLDGLQVPDLPDGVWEGIFTSLATTQGLVQAPALVR